MSRPSRKRRRLQIGAFLSLAIVALALVGGIAVILRTIAVEQAHRAQAARGAEMMTVLRDVNRDAVNAETAQRGYFITLDRRYLAPFLAAEARYEAVLERLRGFATQSGDPRQVALAARIASLTRQKFAEIDRSVLLIEAGNLNEARRLILTDSGQTTMAQLRLAVAEMEQYERRLLERARSQAVDAEQRIVPLLLGLLILILAALGLALSLALRNAEAEAQAAHAAELAEARDRADLLAHELSHRVKNLFAMILAIIRMSARDEPAAKPVTDKISDRVTALLRAQELTKGAGGAQQVELRKLVDAVLAPYRTGHTHGVIEGGDVKLDARQGTPLGLILHELVTNCVKYGAWSQPEGRLAVEWALNGQHDSRLTLTWREQCPGGVVAPDEGKAKGFGSALLEGSIRQLSGELDRRFHDDGIEVRITVPLKPEA